MASSEPEALESPTEDAAAEPAAAPAAESANTGSGMSKEKWQVNEKRRQDIEHARMLKQIAEAVPPCHSNPVVSTASVPFHACPLSRAGAADPARL